MKMNTNSNSYTIIYASVMVVIVAFLLAFVSSSLKATQDKNVQLDTKLVHSDDRLDILTMNKDRHSFLSEQDKNI